MSSDLLRRLDLVPQITPVAAGECLVLWLVRTGLRCPLQEQLRLGLLDQCRGTVELVLERVGATRPRAETPCI